MNPIKLLFISALVAMLGGYHEQAITIAKTLAADTDSEVALEAVKALHFLLLHAEEVVFYPTVASDSTDVQIRTLINGYIGIVH